MNFKTMMLFILLRTFEELISDLPWLDQFGKPVIEQEGYSRTSPSLPLMLFEDGNRIDLTLCPQEHMQEWVDSEAGFTVLEDKKGLFESYSPNPQRYWRSPATETDFKKFL